MTHRRAGCMGNPLVRFCEGQGYDHEMDEILWHRRESRRQQRKQTSSCHHGSPLSTRKYGNKTRPKGPVLVHILVHSDLLSRKRSCRISRAVTMASQAHWQHTPHGLRSSRRGIKKLMLMSARL